MPSAAFFIRLFTLMNRDALGAQTDNSSGELSSDDDHDADGGERLEFLVKKEPAEKDGKQNGGKLQTGAKQRPAASPSQCLRELSAHRADAHGKKHGVRKKVLHRGSAQERLRHG